MTTIIDIIIATVLGGVLMVVALSANDIASENAFIYNGDLYVQETLTTIIMIVEKDMHNMGYGVPEGLAVLAAADSHRISYLVDINRSGTIDTVSYWLGPLADLAHTQNDSDRILYRRIGPGTPGESLTPVAGEDLTAAHSIGYVTRFDLKYYSKSQVDTLVPPVAAALLPLVRIIEITVEVQNPFAPYKKTVVAAGEPDALFSSSMWRQTRLVSRNLNR